MGGTGPASPGRPSGAGGRSWRSDARRNRERLLEAAEAVFAAQGPAASTEEIARRAGVGIGTLFRHFPTKDALLAAIVTARVQRLAEEADALLAAGDPATAFFAFFARATEQLATKRALTALLPGATVDIDVVAPGLLVLVRGRVQALLARAQEAGAVRADIRLPEVLALLAAAGGATDHAAGDPDVGARVVGIILDGLRPSGRR